MLNRRQRDEWESRIFAAFVTFTLAVMAAMILMVIFGGWR